MTHRERFIRTLKCEPIGGQVPTFELVFFLTMEAFGRVHPSQRTFGQWNQMSKTEQDSNGPSVCWKPSVNSPATNTTS